MSLTVGELKEKLQQYDDNRIVIIDNNGDTYGLNSGDFELWNPDDEESPVAIYV